jgi:hypothetical protein
MKLPALTHITFKQCPGAVTLLGAMVPTVEGKADIWPQLQVINLDEVSLWQNGNVDSLCKVLSYRTQRGKPVECVKFDEVTLLASNYVTALKKHVHVETYCVSRDAHSVAVIVD